VEACRSAKQADDSFIQVTSLGVLEHYPAVNRHDKPLGETFIVGRLYTKPLPSSCFLQNGEKGTCLTNTWLSRQLDQEKQKSRQKSLSKLFCS
jgi:hypothetical protein